MKRLRGFSLLEMLLVLVVVSAIIVMGTNYIQQRTTQARIDKSVMDMQQILNAAMAYYVANGKWPDRDFNKNSFTTVDQSLSATDSYALFRNSYLPKASIVNGMPSPWAKVPGSQGNATRGYSTIAAIDSSTGGQPIFYVAMAVQTLSKESAFAYASAIANRLPMGYISSYNASIVNSTISGTVSTSTGGSCSSGICYVVAGVNIPGQNLNNAAAVNFAGLYHHGACIPVPQCPVDANGATMTPQVFVVPVSVSGVNAPPQYSAVTGLTTATVYPISSFTAYATGSPTGGTSPPMCDAGQTNTSAGAGANCASGGTALNNGPYAQNYWRACVKIVTEKGDVSSDRSDYWGVNATLAAFTRCAITDETAGSNFNVYGN